jgi:hypothetical protein
VDLHLAVGLDAVRHLGASGLDLRTLRSAIVALSDDFLTGAGLTAAEIEALRALGAGSG